MEKKLIKISKATIMRLPCYLRYLQEKKREGAVAITSTIISEDMHLHPVQIRKDLALVSLSGGKPKAGFVIDDIISDIENYLGYTNTTDALLIGAGQLGKTLLSYDGFKNYGLNIIAAFDKDEQKTGEFKGKKIFYLNKFKPMVKRMGIKIGIITVPKENAQKVCDLMIDSGIKAIWNFAPVHLVVPEEIALKNEDMASSLALLSKQLQDLNNDKILKEVK